MPTSLSQSSKNTLSGLLAVSLCVAAGAGGTLYLTTPGKPKPDLTAKILAPQSISYAGQYCLLHAVVPGKDPKTLIYTWAVDSRSPVADDAPRPEIRPTSSPGEAQFDTVAGKWRVSAAIADPVDKTGQMLSIDVDVPGTAPGPNPEPQPEPTPNPPPGPQPKPEPKPDPKPNPTPASRFAQFQSDVTKWLAEVTSPDRSTEAAVLANGAREVVANLKTGGMSKLTGTPLRVAVVAAVLANNNKISNATAWVAFGQKVNAAAGAALNSGQLNSADDWAEFLSAFATGLKA